MPDAEVIPLGSRGEPGRGSSRRGTPSSASRSLAGGSARARRAARPGRPAAGPQPVAEPVTNPVEGPAEALGDEPVTEPEPARDVLAPGVPGPDAAAESPLVDLARAVGEAAEELLGEDAQRRLAEVLALARRRLTGDYEVDDYGFDTELTEEVLLPALRPLYRQWFRVEVRGLENVPSEGGALVVSNHSGAIAFDSLMTQLALHDEHPAHRHLRALGADFVFRTPVIGELARKSGATLACSEDAERLLGAGELVGVWPEGFKGIGKPFRERYKLQRFGRGGFVSAALRTGTPIVPCSVVGAEETYPLIGDMPTLARLLGAPYLPVTPTFPWLGPLGLVPLPSKWIIEFGTPVPTDRAPAGAADDPMLVLSITDQVRETIQQTLYEVLVARRRTFF